MLFFLSCLYIIFYYIRPFEWVPGLIGKPGFMVLGVVSLLFLCVGWVNGQIKLFRHSIDKLMVGFFLSILVSHIAHTYMAGLIASFNVFFPLFVGYFLISHGVDTKKKQEAFIMLIIFLTALLAFESYLQVSRGYAHGGLEPLYQKVVLDEDGSLGVVARTRWYGVLNDPNDLGLALILIVPFLLERLYQKKWIISFFTFPLLIYGVYCTNSRGAILALGASIFSYLVIRYRSTKGIIIGLLLMSIGMLFAPSRMSSISAAGASAHGRVDAWYAGFQMFKSNPIFGVGQGMFTDFHVLTAHNSYVLVLSELGLFGSMFFVGMLATPFIWTNKNLLVKMDSHSLDSTLRGQACAIIGSLVGLLSAMFFLSRAYMFLPYLILGFFSSFSRLLSQSQNERNFIEMIFNINWKIIFILLSIEVIFLVLVVKILI